MPHVSVNGRTRSESGIVTSKASSGHGVTPGNRAAFGASSFPGAVTLTSAFWMQDTHKALT